MITAMKNRVILSVHVQPNASKTEFVWLHGGALKFLLASSPIEGKANTELCRYLAKLFAISPNTVSVFSGSANRKKRIEFIGMTEGKVWSVLNLLKWSFTQVFFVNEKRW